MKVLAINGSPRKGNTFLAIEKILEGVESMGAETEHLILKEKNIKDCTGCDICFGTEKDCHIKDDMELEIVPKMKQADLWILGSPNYFNIVSAHMKRWMDRTDPYCKPPIFKDKKVVTVSVGGWSDDSVSRLSRSFDDFLICHGIKAVEKIKIKADKFREIKEMPEVLEMCFQKGKEISKMKIEIEN